MCCFYEGKVRAFAHSTFLCPCVSMSPVSVDHVRALRQLSTTPFVCGDLC